MDPSDAMSRSIATPPRFVDLPDLCTPAGVKRIKFHGLRHTCATLLLQAGTPVHVVSERLGHSKVQMTLEIYAHVLPDRQREAAETIGALLSGKVRSQAVSKPAEIGDFAKELVCGAEERICTYRPLKNR
jgi:Phage integrase family